MRLHPRRALSYILLVICGCVFIVTIHRNSGGLNDKRNIIPIGRHIREYHRGHNDKHSVNISSNLWWSGPDKYNDRILGQISHVPNEYSSSSPLRYIYVPGGIWDTPLGQRKFIEQQCPVSQCYLTAHRPNKADAVLIQNSLDGASLTKYPGQLWILWLLESPLNSISLRWLHDKINWTASYRTDSTIVTPYEKFLLYSNKSNLSIIPARNHAKGKTKMVAWFVSNCNAMNRRLEYARELRRHINVDIFGACGNKRCSRTSRDGKCDQLLNKDYKFYLSFENSNCEYYITEKFFWNALFNDIVPVVMGGRKADYQAVAPPNSFIHVDDFKSPIDLADYLLKLDQKDHLYNEYFLWKNTGSFINTKFWCRMCAMLHDVNKPVMWFGDVENWWRANSSCTRDRWNNPRDTIHNWSSYVINP